jgi:hypothetical protein
MYSVLLDNVFLGQDSIDFYVGKDNGLSSKLISSVIKNCLELLNNKESLHLVNFNLVVKFVNHLLHVNSHDNLASLLNLAFNKNYLDFCNLFFSS